MATASARAATGDDHLARITAALDTPALRRTADTYLRQVQTVVTGITRADAVELLTHHAATLPLFDALLGGYPHRFYNPLSRVLAAPLAALEAAGALDPDPALRAIYDRARNEAAAVTDHAQRQPLICGLYEGFFRAALPRLTDRLGIVYTPVEVVDYMLRSTDQALRNSHGRPLSDEGVTILDPCAGTGIFLVRLLQSNLIDPADLLRKYRYELHSHEIVPLSYYIASVNIEAAFYDRTHHHHYLPFTGLRLVDTFSPDLPCCPAPA